MEVRLEGNQAGRSLAVGDSSSPGFITQHSLEFHKCGNILHLPFHVPIDPCPTSDLP